LPPELLYGDDFILMAASEESLHEKTAQWNRDGSKRFEDEYRKKEGNDQL